MPRALQSLIIVLAVVGGGCASSVRFIERRCAPSDQPPEGYGWWQVVSVRCEATSGCETCAERPIASRNLKTVRWPSVIRVVP